MSPASQSNLLNIASIQVQNIQCRIQFRRDPIRKDFKFDSTAQLIELGKPVVLDALVSQSKRKRLTLMIEHFDPSIKREQ